LGLSTCKIIAEALKGDIFLLEDDDQDQQSLLIFSIPRFNYKKPEGTAIALVL
jgi:hypothetical protein